MGPDGRWSKPPGPRCISAGVRLAMALLVLRPVQRDGVAIRALLMSRHQDDVSTEGWRTVRAGYETEYAQAIAASTTAYPSCPGGRHRTGRAVREHLDVASTSRREVDR